MGIVLASADLQSPNSDHWPLATSMITARDSFSVARLLCGRVLAAGDVHEVGVISKAEIHDLSQDAWQAVGCMIEARFCFEKVVLANGTVLAAGGYNSQDEPLASAELYNSATCTWSSAGSMSHGQGSFAC